MNQRRARASAAVFVVAVASSYGDDLRAQSSGDKAAAVELFDSADKLISEGKYADACPKFAESQKLDPQLGTLLHLADCLEKNGQTTSAWATWRDGAELAQKRGDERAKVAAERARALEPKVARIRLELQTPDLPGLEVRRDGVLVGRPLWGGAPVDPGSHEIQVVAPGKKPWAQRVDVVSGESKSIAIPALADEAGSAPPPEPAHGASDAPSGAAAAPVDRGNSGAGQRTLGLVLGGVGVMGLGVGTYFTLKRSQLLSDRDDVCPSTVNCTRADLDENDRLTKDARSATTLSYVGFGLGGALLASGVVLYLTAPHEPRRSASWAVTPMIDSRSSALGVVGVW